MGFSVILYSKYKPCPIEVYFWVCIPLFGTVKRLQTVGCVKNTYRLPHEKTHSHIVLDRGNIRTSPLVFTFT